MYTRNLTSEDMLCAAELMASCRKFDACSRLWMEWILDYCQQSETRLLAGAFDGSRLAAVMAAGFSNPGGGADDGCIEIHGYWASLIQNGVYPSSQLILFVFNQFEVYRPKKVVLYNTPRIICFSIARKGELELFLFSYHFKIILLSSSRCSVNSDKP